MVVIPGNNKIYVIKIHGIQQKHSTLPIIEGNHLKMPSLPKSGDRLVINPLS